MTRPAPRILIARTPAEREDTLRVRIAVFVEEQQIPREEEIDEHDGTAVFCVAYDGDTPVGAGRLVLADGYGKIGRMAVLAPERGRHIGAGILAALEAEGAAEGVRLFRLSAQLYAAGFYERAGYIRVGDAYDEVGIPHIAMEKRVAS